MAGVGFGLKKMFRGRGVLAVLRGYSVAAVVTEGPMVLMILLLLALQRLLEGFGTVYRLREQLLFFMTYAMIFSLLLAGTVLLFLDRFISDCIYQQRLQDVLPAFFGMVFFLLLAGAPVMGLYIHIRVNLQHTLFHDCGLVFAYCFAGCNDLAVEIGEAHLVIIDQIKGTHTASYQSFAHISAYTADSKHSHSCIGKLFHAVFSKKQLGS